MTFAEISVEAFAFLNCARLVAYIPQLICVGRDQHGAAAVSLLTWALFMLANIATVGYTLTVAGDKFAAGIFALNAVGCFAVLVVAASKRLTFLAKG
jgi:hypothetical protein